MAQIAQQAGLSGENGTPTLKTTIAVMKSLGIALTAKAHAGA
jgi:DNA-binding phage protein